MLGIHHLAERKMMIMAKTKTAAEAIPTILERYGDSLMAGDPDQWITNWTEDCVQLPPGGPMVVGKGVLYKSISAWLDAYIVSDFKIHGDWEVQEAGNWAYSRGNFSYRLTKQDGSLPYVYQGKVLTILKRQSNGEWKIHRDCFNSNTPDH
jgi:ketosteroid isomerase-like protein